MSENLMKAAVLGGLAGVSGVANVVDEMYLKKSLGFKKRDSAQSAFVRGGQLVLLDWRLSASFAPPTALDMFGLGAPMHTKDRTREPRFRSGGVCSASRRKSMPPTITSVKTPTAAFVIDPKYAL